MLFYQTLSIDFKLILQYSVQISIANNILKFLVVLKITGRLQVEKVVKIVTVTLWDQPLRLVMFTQDSASASQVQ